PLRDGERCGLRDGEPSGLLGGHTGPPLRDGERSGLRDGERSGLRDGERSGHVGADPRVGPSAAYGRMAEASAGKDSVTGHWEMVGVISRRQQPVYPHGFPPEVIDAFSRAVGRGVIGNKAASGTAIVEELGDEHVRTGKLIVY